MRIIKQKKGKTNLGEPPVWPLENISKTFKKRSQLLIPYNTKFSNVNMGTFAKKEKKPTPCYIDFNLENNIFKISLNFCKGNKNRPIFEICVILFFNCFRCLYFQPYNH